MLKSVRLSAECYDKHFAIFILMKNIYSKNEKLSSRGERQQNLDLLLESDQDTLNEYYRFIDKCPCCGKKMINVRFNKERWVLEHICDNPDCPADVLPLFIVDSEIYRYLPSI